MKRICPRCNNELSTNCYVKDKGINTLSYLELIIKKDQFNKEHKEIKSCYCPKSGYVELYVDVDHQNQHLKKDDDLNSLRQTVRQYAIDYHQHIELERKKTEEKEILDKKRKLESLIYQSHIQNDKKRKRKITLRKTHFYKSILGNVNPLPLTLCVSFVIINAASSIFKISLVSVTNSRRLTTDITAYISCFL